MGHHDSSSGFVNPTPTRKILGFALRARSLKALEALEASRRETSMVVAGRMVRDRSHSG
jgi:hypothetical protein